MLSNSERPREEIENNQNAQSTSQINGLPWVAIKSFLIISVITILTLNTIYGFAMPKGEVACLDDRLFNLTASINAYFATHSLQKQILLATSSLLIDSLIVITAIHWVLYSKTWRLVLALIFFYLFRGIVQCLFQMRFPNGYLWDYPNFPSLTVSYLKTNDFFFSGHVGLPILIAREWKTNNNNILFGISIGICAIEIMTMIFLRGHYTIDLIAGVIFALYFYEVCASLSKYVDNISWLNMCEQNKDGENKEDGVFKKAEIVTEADLEKDNAR